METIFDFATFDNFSKVAQKLRREFEDKYLDVRSTRLDRFQWDPFSIPDQYQFLRTPAQSFFSTKDFESFAEKLVIFGRENFACENISTPWLSLYREGDFQGMHADLPHGPFAFVFSLSPSGEVFSGGETLLLKSKVLSYWAQNHRGANFEQGEVFERISPKFNRLTIFDPRIPHGVSPVSRAQTPLEGRLVIHGWFVNPGPQIEGTVSSKSAQKFLDVFVGEFLESTSPLLHNFQGTLIIEIRNTFEKLSAQLKLSTLRNPIGEGIHKKLVNARIAQIIRQPKIASILKSSCKLLLPISFEV